MKNARLIADSRVSMIYGIKLDVIKQFKKQGLVRGDKDSVSPADIRKIGKRLGLASTLKRCSQCGEKKNILDFSISLDKLRPACIECEKNNRKRKEQKEQEEAVLSLLSDMPKEFPDETKVVCHPDSDNELNYADRDGVNYMEQNGVKHYSIRFLCSQIIGLSYDDVLPFYELARTTYKNKIIFYSASKSFCYYCTPEVFNEMMTEIREKDKKKYLISKEDFLEKIYDCDTEIYFGDNEEKDLDSLLILGSACSISSVETLPSGQKVVIFDASNITPYHLFVFAPITDAEAKQINSSKNNQVFVCGRIRWENERVICYPDAIYGHKYQGCNSSSLPEIYLEF